MAGVDFICLVATSLTFGTTGFSIVSVGRTPALLLLIPVFDLFTSDALIAGSFTTDPVDFVPAGFTGWLFAGAIFLVTTRAGRFGTSAFLAAAAGFFAMAFLAADCDGALAAFFVAGFASLLEAAFAPIFTVAFTDLAAGLSVPAAFLSNLVMTLFSVDAPDFPAPFVFAVVVDLAIVLPGFFAVTVFLADFVTVAFMSSILDELSNALTSSGAASDLIVLATDKTPTPLA